MTTPRRLRSPVLELASAIVVALLATSGGATCRTSASVAAPAPAVAAAAAPVAAPVAAPTPARAPAPAPAPVAAPPPAAAPATAKTPAAVPSTDADCPSRKSLAAAALVYGPRERTASLWLVPLTDGAPRKIATVPRAPDTPVSGAAIPGTDLVAVTVSPRHDRDPTWSGALYLLGPDRQPARLLDGVHAGGRPAGASGGRVLAVRGGRGAERAAADPSAGYRRDRLELVAVDATKATTRSLGTETGDALFLAGVVGDEVIVYRVGVEDGKQQQQRQQRPAEKGPPGDFVAVDLGSGAVRPLLAHAPALARDFSVDAAGKRIWFAALRPDGERDRPWGVFTLDLTTGQLSLAASGDSMAFGPAALPGGRVVYRCPGSEAGLCVGSASSGREREARPLGPGRDEVQATTCTSEGAVAFGVHEAGSAGRSPTPFVWNVAEPSGRSIALPPGRVQFVGVVRAPAK